MTRRIKGTRLEQKAQDAPCLICDTCGDQVPLSAPAPVCPACATPVPLTEDGTLDLRQDVSFDTLLDIASYDDAHGVRSQNRRLAQFYEGLLRDAGLGHARHILEIGAGSGNLTSGLVELDFFGLVYASELSPGFMRLLKQRLGEQREEQLRCVLLDANALPFADCGFDCVLGHSVLHHLARFEQTLRESYRVTRPGGICAFGEPVLDIHAYVSFAAQVILELEAGTGALGRREMQVLRALAQRARLKRENLEGDRARLAEVEDKFIFPVEHMRRLAREIGFSRMDCVGHAGQHSLGGSCRMIIERSLDQRGDESGFLDSYAFIFDALTATVGDSMDMNGLTPFSFFVFVK